MNLKAVKLFLLLIVIAVVATGCRGCLQNTPFGKYFGQSPSSSGYGSGIESSAIPEPIRGQTPHEVADLKAIYYQFDSASLLGPAEKQLAANAAWMRANPGVQIQIEGHCDERGTADYNYALGQRRADSARNYLVSQGVDGGRLHTISYGSERPADSGNSEMAWAHNRRAAFLVYGGQ